MEENGIIERVTEPTEWVAPMVPVIKHSGKVMICVGLTKLNENVKREKYVLPTIDSILHKLAGSAVYSTLDAACGFWQIARNVNSDRVLFSFWAMLSVRMALLHSLEGFPPLLP